MLCDHCGKKPANVHFTQVINNQVTELHLCEECASKKGIGPDNPFSIADFLAGIPSIESGFIGSESASKSQLKCSVCGMTLEDFQKTGRLGCANCYVVFRHLLRNILKRVHGNINHMGKAPLYIEKAQAGKESVANLRKALQKAIEEEEYEKAVEIRDKIRKLEAGT